MKINPITRLVLIAVLSTLCVLALDLFYLAVVFFAAFAVNMLLKINILHMLKRLRFLISLIIFVTLLQSLAVKGGRVIVGIGKVHILTVTGLIKGGEFALRMGTVVLSSMIALSAEGREMTDALIQLKLPYEFAFMTNIALRFIPVFREEFINRLNALAMRGIDIKKLAFKKKIKAYSYIISPAVSGSIIKSRQLAAAMEAKAFGAYNKRTMLRELKLNFIDYFVIIMAAASLVAFLCIMYIKGAVL
ncbi:MAG: energy-coupling factor transporter transmembrane component T family protein [Christensenellales bacterium]|jgi:energy-coupling factor transport system permease protein|nr:energy-coupling factor transporter transmembrane protein EcfT [Clostridiales bacterium]